MRCTAVNIQNLQKDPKLWCSRELDLRESRNLKRKCIIMRLCVITCRIAILDSGNGKYEARILVALPFDLLYTVRGCEILSLV